MTAVILLTLALGGWVVLYRRRVKKLELDQRRAYSRFLVALYSCRNRNSCSEAVMEWLRQHPESYSTKTDQP